MQPCADTTSTTPEQRLREIAGILATGILRLHACAALHAA